MALRVLVGEFMCDIKEKKKVLLSKFFGLWGENDINTVDYVRELRDREDLRSWIFLGSDSRAKLKLRGIKKLRYLREKNFDK